MCFGEQKEGPCSKSLGTAKCMRNMRQRFRLHSCLSLWQSQTSGKQEWWKLTCALRQRA